MKKIFILIFAHCFLSVSYTQSFFSNNSGLVSIKDSALLSVQGDIFIENNGIFDNSDTIKFTKDWINNAGNTGFSSTGEGFVYLIGEDQRIQGTDETHFHNLLLKNIGIKYGDLDVFVDGFLDLDSLEFSLDTNIVYVTNSEINAVLTSNGFVSSLENGGLSRQTDTVAEYFFPVGSSIYGKIYRPVSVKTTNSPQTYRARFANDDPTNEGYDRDEKALRICAVNENYFHKIWQDQGADSSDLKFYFHSAIDGSQYNDIVHWEGLPQWEKTPADTLINTTNWDILEVKNWNNYDTENFALAFSKNRFADAGQDQTIYLLDTIQLSGSGGDFYEWTPAFAVNCPDCQEPLFWHDSTQTMVLRVEDADNCVDIDSVTITVDDRMEDGNPFIPNAISPNADGVNDAWYIRWLYKFPDNEVIIVNRWEDIVYKAAPYNNDWYGTYNGKRLPEGTYYYVLKVKGTGSTKEKTYTGPLTIIK